MTKEFVQCFQRHVITSQCRKCHYKNLTVKDKVLKIAMNDLDNGMICYMYGQELANVSILVS